jgi:hypothetical protein
MEMELQIYFAFSVANLAFGRSLWIEIVVRPLEGDVQCPEDSIVPAAVPFLNLTFSLGASIVQIRVASQAGALPRDWYGGALVWAVALIVGAAATAGTLVTLSALVNRRNCENSMYFCW